VLPNVWALSRGDGEAGDVGCSAMLGRAIIQGLEGASDFVKRPRWTVIHGVLATMHRTGYEVLKVKREIAQNRHLRRREGQISCIAKGLEKARHLLRELAR